MSIFAVKFLTRTNPYRRRRDCDACPEEFLRCEGLPLLSWETNAPVAKSWREGHQMAATTPSPWQHKNDSSGNQARWDFVGDEVLQLCAYVLTQTESERYGIPCSTIFLSQWQTHQWQAPPIFARATGPGKQEWVFKTLQHFQLSSRFQSLDLRLGNWCIATSWHNSWLAQQPDNICTNPANSIRPTNQMYSNVLSSFEKSN